jgi:hypothetical protein
VRREEPVKQRRRVDGRAARDGLRGVGQADEDQEDERNRGQQRVEGERTGQEGNVVLVSGLEGAAKEAGGRTMPPAGPNALQASGSS